MQILSHFVKGYQQTAPQTPSAPQPFWAHMRTASAQFHIDVTQVFQEAIQPNQDRNDLHQHHQPNCSHGQHKYSLFNLVHNSLLWHETRHEQIGFRSSRQNRIIFISKWPPLYVIFRIVTHHRYSVKVFITSLLIYRRFETTSKINVVLM